MAFAPPPQNIDRVNICEIITKYMSKVNLRVIDKQEHMFYNWGIATGNVWEVLEGIGMKDGNADEYRKDIIEIVNKIENLQILRLIWGFAKSGYEEEKAGS